MILSKKNMQTQKHQEARDKVIKLRIHTTILLKSRE